MFDPENLEKTVEFSPYVLHYSARDKRVGVGGGVHGIRHEKLVKTYIDTLKKTSKILERAGWTKRDNSVHVYVCDLVTWVNSSYPFSFPQRPIGEEDEKTRLIGLRSRFDVASMERVIELASVEAAHEAIHIANWEYHNSYDEPNWHWLDEATCVLLETEIVEFSQDNLKYALEWVDRPDVPLDGTVGYQQYPFLKYLCGRKGKSLASQVSSLWTSQIQAETNNPFAAIQRFLGHEPFVSMERNCFFENYCRDSYFLKENFPDIALRFASRMVAESFELSEVQPEVKSEPYRLPRLSCMYFRFYLAPTFGGKIQFEIVFSNTSKEPSTFVGSDHENRIKGTACSAYLDGSRAESTGVDLALTLDESNCRLSGMVNVENSETIDHFVLVVTNVEALSSASSSEFFVTAKLG